MFSVHMTVFIGLQCTGGVSRHPRPAVTARPFGGQSCIGRVYVQRLTPLTLPSRALMVFSVDPVHYESVLRRYNTTCSGLQPALIHKPSNSWVTPFEHLVKEGRNGNRKCEQQRPRVAPQFILQRATRVAWFQKQAPALGRKHRMRGREAAPIPNTVAGKDATAASNTGSDRWIRVAAPLPPPTPHDRCAARNLHLARICPLPEQASELTAELMPAPCKYVLVCG